MRPYIDLQPQAMLLRKEGYLYAEIARKLGVARSTAHLWASDVELSEESDLKIKQSLKASKAENIRKNAVQKKILLDKRNSILQSEALEIVNSLDYTTNYKRLLCAIMFWCEGAKDTKGGIFFINSDPIMMSKFLSLLRGGFQLDERKFRGLIHLHDYHDEATQLEYWSKITQIPHTQFHKSYRKPHTGKNTREGYPGCLSLRYLDSALAKLLKMIYIEFGKL